MDYYMNSEGYFNPCIKEYEVNTEENLAKGTLLTIADGKAEKLTASTEVILGVLAEDYNIQKDEFNPRNGNGAVRVIVSPGAIYRQDNFKTEITSAGTETTVSVSDITMPSGANAFKGGYIKLVKKGENSGNTDSVGSVRKITASAGSTLTVEEGGVASIGDVYEILPPAGFAYIKPSEDGKSFVTASSKAANAKAVCASHSCNFTEFALVTAFFN